MKPVFRLAIVLLMAGMSSLVFGQDRQDRFFDSNGVRIRYIEQGTGEPVVLVHGYTGSMISPKGQPMPSEEVMKQAEAGFRAEQVLAAVARSIPDLKITVAQVAAIKVPTLAIIGI